MYSKIHSRLDWFFGYIGEPQEDFIPDLYGDVNFDGSININDIVIMVNFVLGQTPTDEQFITGDMNYDEVLNILDVVLLVNLVLDGDYNQSGDLNNDSVLNVLDIVLIINNILN